MESVHTRIKIKRITYINTNKFLDIFIKDRYLLPRQHLRSQFNAEPSRFQESRAHIPQRTHRSLKSAAIKSRAPAARHKTRKNKAEAPLSRVRNTIPAGGRDAASITGAENRNEGILDYRSPRFLLRSLLTGSPGKVVQR